MDDKVFKLFLARLELARVGIEAGDKLADDDLFIMIAREFNDIRTRISTLTNENDLLKTKLAIATGDKSIPMFNDEDNPYKSGSK